jgi:DNA-binding transcriptional LysR family regulator
MIDLRQLRQFVAVAEELSFRRAAQRLHMSQPPLSQAIRGLEAELGTALFNRTRRKVELTQPGRVLLDEAHRVLSQMGRALAAARGAARGMTGRLAVGFVPSSTYEILPAILRRVRLSHPAVDLHLEELDTVDQTDALLQRRIDVALNRPPTFFTSDVVQETLVRERLIAALPADHPLAARKSLRLRDLREERFLLIPPRWGTGYHTRVLDACQEAGFVPRVEQEAKYIHTLIGLVAAGMGLALVPDSLANLKSRGCVYRVLADRTTALTIDLGAAWRANDAAPALHAFLDAARAVGRRPSGERRPPIAAGRRRR